MSTVPSLRDGTAFPDTHVLVTGAARGIGRHIAREFAAADARVTVLDVTQTPRSGEMTTVEKIREEGGEATFVEADLTDERAVEEAVRTAVETHSPLGVLVNNAGVNHLGRVDEVTVEEWDRTLAVNLRGTFLVTRFALPSLRETAGNVVNVASTAGLHGSPNYAAYGPSKAGVLNLTRQLARDFSPAGVRVNAVAPGVIDAGMAAQELRDPETAAYKREMTLLDRLGTEQDVSNAVLFLASPASSFVTGETLVVDGGWCA